MSVKINIKNVISVALSVVNIAIVLPFSFIVVEYYEIFFTGYTGHLQFHTIPFDVGIILLSLGVIIFSSIIIIKYFRNKKVPFVAPIIITVLYSIFWTISFISG